MIPILFPANYEVSGYYPAATPVGRLSDALSCVVTEELNGVYELEMTYPADGLYAAQLMQPCTLAVLRPYADGTVYKRELAWFDVCSRTVEGGVMTVNACHISYRLAGVVCARVPATNTLSGAIGMISGNILPSLYTRPWSEFRFVEEEITLDSSTFSSADVKSVREYLFDDNYSVRKVFGAEAAFHGTDIHLGPSRGEDRGAEIRYGKNLAGGTISRDETGVYNAIFPYWRGTVDGLAKAVLSDALVYPATTMNPVRALAVDFSSYFQNEPSRAALKALAQEYLTENEPWLARETADITFDPDWQQGAAGGTVREVVDLGDTVSVFYGDADLVGAKMRVVRIRYDVLLEHFSEFTLGQLERGYAVTSRDGLSATRQIMA